MSSQTPASRGRFCRGSDIYWEHYLHAYTHSYMGQMPTPVKYFGILSVSLRRALHIPFPDEFDTVEDTGSCVRGDGRGFSGLQTITRSGKSCQLWESNYPHQHPMLPDIYRADLRKPNSHYSCRNPGGIGDRPWCYTLDPDTRWDYCEIPKCGQQF